MTVVVTIIHGLAMFSLGVACLLETRRRSALLLEKQLPWLAGFALVESAGQWLCLLEQVAPAPPWVATVRLLLLPFGALLLIRFGVGLLSGGGSLPGWLLLSPFIFLVPAGLVLAYLLIVALTEPDILAAGTVSSRYLLLFPGGLLTAWGFVRQSDNIPRVESSQVRLTMRMAGVTFLVYTIAVGLMVPDEIGRAASSAGLKPPAGTFAEQVHLWQTVAALAMSLTVVRALGLFEAVYALQLAQAESQRRAAEQVVRSSEKRFRSIFENAPIGIDIVAPSGKLLRANRALQQMLGYSEEELQEKVFADFTHPDDVADSLRLTQEVAAGVRNSFQMRKRYRHKEGHLVEGKVTVAGIRDDEGQFKHFIAMVEDITEQNRMRRALQEEQERLHQARLRAQAEARRVAESWIQSLVEVSRRIAHMEPLENILSYVASETLHLLDVDVVSIGLFDESMALGIRCQGTRQAGAGKVTLHDPPLIIDNESLLSMLRSGRPHRFPQDVPDERANWYCPTVAGRVHAAAAVPLQFDDNVVGGLWVARFAAEPFTLPELRGLGYLADQVIIALQQATLASQLQSVATMEERSRIAREMHDGLAQILGYLGLQVQTIEAFLEQGEEERALSELQRTRQNVRLAQADVRENILSLRTTLSGSAGLKPALEEYLCEFGIQAGIVTHFVDDTGVPLSLSPLAEVQLVRIVQEALANVRKHAGANSVTVRLHLEAGRLCVAVADNGCGFDPLVVGEKPDSFGLATMRERAEAIDGWLEVDSSPGEGATVLLCVPQLGSDEWYGQETPALYLDRR